MPKPANQRPKLPWHQELEPILAIIITLLSVSLHLVFMFHAGALWRDEVNEVNLAAMPSLGEALAHDSFPILWVLVLKIFRLLGLTGDFDLRILGCLIGVATIGILWFAARRMKFSWPIFSLLLIGFSSSIIRWGDSIRPWGLAIALILLTFALIWSLVESPTRKNFLFATIAAVASVQCIYYNAVLLLAICAGALAVVLRENLWAGADVRRLTSPSEKEKSLSLVTSSPTRWKSFWMVLGVGLIAAISLLPYISTIKRAMPIYLVMQQPSYDVRIFCEKISEALAPAGEHGKFGIYLWLTLAATAMATAIFCQIRPSTFNATPAQKNLLLFSLTTLVVGVVGYFLFLQRARLATQAWYYIVLMAVAAMAIDAMLSVFANRKSGAILRVAAVIGAVGLSLLPVFRQVHLRQTNVDVLATKLQMVAGKNDLILVNPWFAGLSFERYYRGSTRWMTIPPMADHKTHRYDLVKQAMMAADQIEPMQPVLEKMTEALKSGGRVWLVGGVRLMSDEEMAQGRPMLPPAPTGPDGWSDTAYYNLWSMQAAYFLQRHAPVLEKYNPPVAGPVSEHEFVGMGFAAGWKD